MSAPSTRDLPTPSNTSAGSGDKRKPVRLVRRGRTIRRRRRALPSTGHGVGATIHYRQRRYHRRCCRRSLRRSRRRRRRCRLIHRQTVLVHVLQTGCVVRRYDRTLVFVHIFVRHFDRPEWSKTYVSQQTCVCVCSWSPGSTQLVEISSPSEQWREKITVVRQPLVRARRNSKYI